MIPLLAASASFTFTAHPTNLYDLFGSIFLLGAYVALFLLILLIFSLSLSIRISNALFGVEKSDLPKCLTATFLWMFFVTAFEFALQWPALRIPPQLHENLGMAGAFLSTGLAIKIVFRPHWFRALISGIVAFPMSAMFMLAGFFGVMQAFSTFAPQAAGQ